MVVFIVVYCRRAVSVSAPEHMDGHTCRVRVKALSPPSANKIRMHEETASITSYLAIIYKSERTLTLYCVQSNLSDYSSSEGQR
jgi:hypothetical protein